MCDKLGLREGDFVEVAISRNHVVVRPKRLVNPEDTLTRHEEKIVERGFQQLKRGQYVKWSKLRDELGL
jgi:antitoxin component of MazEF toxin-antitoxin module